jgi:alpha-galactosidase/6-phospho-beta-glucosidase family protein
LRYRAQLRQADIEKLRKTILEWLVVAPLVKPEERAVPVIDHMLRPKLEEVFDFVDTLP